MKILHVITTIERGGAEIQLLTLARNQTSLGNQVFIHYLKGNPELANDFEDFQVEILPPSRYFISNILRLRKIMRQGFDVAHAHLPRAELQLILAQILSKKTSTLIASRHNAESFFPAAPMLISRFLSKMVLRSFAGVIFISSTVKDYVYQERELPKCTKTAIIYYGYDERVKETQVTRSQETPFTPKFLFVGRLTQQKNVPLLISAFKIHLEKSPLSELHIYGSGRLEKSLQLSTVDIANNVIWHGRSSRLNDIMRHSTCLVLPSLYEGFGLVLLEAMQNGLPILAANTSAIPEVLGIEHPGLFSIQNFESLSEKMYELCSTPLPNRILKFQEKRLELFNPKIMVTRTQAFYLDCTKKDDLFFD